MREWQGKGASVSLCVIGSKALAFFRRLELPILASVTAPGRPAARASDLIGTVKVMLDAYREGKLDRLFLVQCAVRQHHDAAAAAYCSCCRSRQ